MEESLYSLTFPDDDDDFYIPPQSRYEQLCSSHTDITCFICYDCGEVINHRSYYDHRVLHEMVFLSHQLHIFELNEEKRLNLFKKRSEVCSEDTNILDKHLLLSPAGPIEINEPGDVDVVSFENLPFTNVSSNFGADLLFDALAEELMRSFSMKDSIRRQRLTKKRKLQELQSDAISSLLDIIASRDLKSSNVSLKKIGFKRKKLNHDNEITSLGFHIPKRITDPSWKNKKRRTRSSKNNHLKWTSIRETRKIADDDVDSAFGDLQDTLSISDDLNNCYSSAPTLKFLQSPNDNSSFKSPFRPRTNEDLLKPKDQQNLNVKFSKLKRMQLELVATNQMETCPDLKENRDVSHANIRRKYEKMLISKVLSNKQMCVKIDRSCRLPRRVSKSIFAQRK